MPKRKISLDAQKISPDEAAVMPPEKKALTDEMDKKRVEFNKPKTKPKYFQTRAQKKQSQQQNQQQQNQQQQKKQQNQQQQKKQQNQQQNQQQQNQQQQKKQQNQQQQKKQQNQQQQNQQQQNQQQQNKQQQNQQQQNQQQQNKQQQNQQQQNKQQNQQQQKKQQNQQQQKKQQNQQQQKKQQNQQHWHPQQQKNKQGHQNQTDQLWKKKREDTLYHPDQLFRNLKELQDEIRTISSKAGKEPPKMLPGVRCELCSVILYDSRSFQSHWRSATHLDMFHMSKARDDGVIEQLKANSKYMTARENSKIKQNYDKAPLMYCKQCNVNYNISRDNKVKHEDSLHHQLVYEFQYRTCKICMPKLSMDAFHRTSIHHIWWEKKTLLQQHLQTFGCPFNGDQNLPVSCERELKLQDTIYDLKRTYIDNEIDKHRGDYDPTRPIGMSCIHMQISNYCLPCQAELPRIKTVYQQGDTLYPELHCFSFGHYAMTQRFLRQNKDKLNSARASQKDRWTATNIGASADEDKELTDKVIEEEKEVNPEKKTEAETVTMEVEESPTSKSDNDQTDDESITEVLKENDDDESIVDVLEEDDDDESTAEELKKDDDDESTAEVHKEDDVGSTQSEESEQLPKDVALIGDSWIQDFPIDLLPDKWNVSKFGWKEESAKAFLVKEDVQPVIDSKPSVAVIHLGANDICKKYSGGSICCDILDIVTSLEEENITTFVCEIPSKTAPKKISEKDYETVRSAVNADLLQKLPKSTHIINISNLKDHLHNGVDLSAEGYVTFADILTESIESKLSDDTTDI